MMEGNIFKEPKTLSEVFKEFENFELDEELKSLDSQIVEEKCPKPSQLRISTMTATCKTGLNVNLNIIYKYSEIQDLKSDKEGIIKIEFGDEQIRGTSKKDIENKKTKKKKVFYNQATIIFKLIEGNNHKEVNMKVFTNGNIQMTGLKSIEDGKKAVQMFYNETKNLKGVINNKDNGQIKTISGVENPDSFIMKEFEIVLINSDYSTHFKIKRDVLHSLLVKQYKIFSSYEPCIYPGVNSKYFWNEDYKNKLGMKEGICHCTKPCNGKGIGKGDGKCKKITISVFQSGNIIITGARSLEQIDDAYNFINKVLKKNYSLLKRETIPLLDISDSESEDEECGKSILEFKEQKNIVYLKKSAIKLDDKYCRN
jgi:TATA-box binding protein (TBP) (component of TFIID and TFIIIB)